MRLREDTVSANRDKIFTHKIARFNADVRPPRCRRKPTAATPFVVPC
jgi:hypothetical protein